MKSICRSKFLFLMVMTIAVTGIFCPLQSVHAAQKNITISQVKKMALAGNDSYRKVKNQIALKEISYEQSVKTLTYKEKDEGTYRWSPMFSFYLTESMDFVEESNLVYTPLLLQTEIKQLQNSLIDEMYGIWEEAEQTYLKVYTYQEKVKLDEERLTELNKTLKKVNGRIVLGLSKKTEAEEIEDKISNTKEQLAEDKKNFILEKEKLSEFIKLDVSTQYIFESPYIEVDIPRLALEEITCNALEYNKRYFDTKMESQLLLFQLKENYALLEKQYGSDATMLKIFVEQIQNGQETDYNAFKVSYDRFLEKIEETWEGEWKIMSLSVPKEWIKKEDSGFRYIEDNPYALYENSVEYQQRLEELQIIEKELEEQLKTDFEQLLTAQKVYSKLEKEKEKSENKLKKEKLLNSMGELSFEEYGNSQRQYEQLKMEQLEALETYTSLVFQLDRLTCGAVSKYLENTEELQLTEDYATKYLVETEEIEGAKYYIQSLVEDNMFEFSISLPKDLKTKITHYELRVDDYVIGQKTEVENAVRHLTIFLTGKEKVYVRLYKEKEFVDDCEIDIFAHQGSLKIESYSVKEVQTKNNTAKEKAIGSYEIINKSEMGLMEILLQFNVAENIAYYSIQNKDGKSLISEEKKNKTTDSFTYLEFSPEEMKTLKIQCYDKEKVLKYTAYFNTKRYEIYKVDETKDSVK